MLNDLLRLLVDKHDTRHLTTSIVYWIFILLSSLFLYLFFLFSRRTFWAYSLGFLYHTLSILLSIHSICQFVIPQKFFPNILSISFKSFQFNRFSLELIPISLYTRYLAVFFFYFFLNKKYIKSIMCPSIICVYQYYKHDINCANWRFCNIIMKR